MGKVFLVVKITSLHCAVGRTESNNMKIVSRSFPGRIFIQLPKRRAEAFSPVLTCPMCRQFSNPITSIRWSPISEVETFISVTSVFGVWLIDKYLGWLSTGRLSWSSGRRALCPPPAVFSSCWMDRNSMCCGEVASARDSRPTDSSRRGCRGCWVTPRLGGGRRSGRA